MTRPIWPNLQSRFALAPLLFALAGAPCDASPRVGQWTEPQQQSGTEATAGVLLLTGTDHKPYQTQFKIPELADPYLSFLVDSVVISGTAQYHLKFNTLQDVARGGPFSVVWNDFYYPDGTPMEGERFHAHSWDMKPVLWSSTPGNARLWDPTRETAPPVTVWYGGRMRPRADPGGLRVSRWPQDNFSRDVFAFVEKEPGKWFSMAESVFAGRGDWPRPVGNHLGHRYGHHIVSSPDKTPVIFFEEVTHTHPGGGPKVTSIFMDEMATPFLAAGGAIELITPVNRRTGKYYPSTVREDGSALVEGPLYFKFQFEGELWEAIGFSAGSFYGRYPSCFAARRVSDGLNGKPYLPDLNDDESDLHDAGAALGTLLKLAGGPGRPAVIIGRDGLAVPDAGGNLPMLFHAYRRSILPDHEFLGFPIKHGLHEMFRSVFGAALRVTKRPSGVLRFEIVASKPRVRSLRTDQRSRVYATAARPAESAKKHPRSSF